MTLLNLLSPTIRYEPEARQQRSSHLRLRARVLLHSRQLDQRLLDGVDPNQSPELALRARQLTSESYRRTLADGLDEVVEVAEGRAQRPRAAVPLARREVRAARGALLELAEALRRARPVEAAGVVLAVRLLSDGTGPLYRESQTDGLWHAARAATAALD